MRKTLFILCALVCASMAWATTATTFTYESHFKGKGSKSPGSAIKVYLEGDTVSIDKAGALDYGHVRVFAGSVITIKAGYTISKVEVACTANGTSEYGPSKLSSQTDAGQYAYSGKVGTWTLKEGQDTKVVKLKATAQARLTQIVVYTEVQSEGPVAVKDVSLDQTQLEMVIGQQTQLTARINPDNADNQEVSWSVLNGHVAVENGLVTALTAGEDEVTVTTTDGGKTATCAVVVKEGSTLDNGAVIYQKVTKAADLVAGRQYIVLYEAGSVAAGTWDTKKYRATPAKIMNNQATAPQATVFTLGGTTDAWTIATTSGYLQITGTSNGNLICDATTAATWTIATIGNSIVSNDYTSRGLRFNNASEASGGQVFTNYATTKQETIQLYYSTGEVYGKPAVEQVHINAKELVIRKGATTQLQAVVSPYGADNTIIWTSSDDAVATVVDGLVSGLTNGQVKITATANNGVYDSCMVKVADSVHVTGILLDKASATMVELSTLQLVATIQPSDADNQRVIWESANNDVATVDDQGVVTAIRYGETTITAKSEEFPSLMAQCQLRVSAQSGDRYHLMTKDSVLNDGDLIVFYNAAVNKASAGLVDSKKYLSGMEAVVAGTDLIINESQPMRLTKKGSYWNLSINGTTIGHNQSSENSVDFTIGVTTDFAITISESNMAIVKSQTSSNPQFYCNAQGNFRLYNSTSMSPIQLYRKVANPDVPIAVEGVELDYVAVTLREGESEQLNATVLPEDAKIKDVEWGSLDESIATVVNGQIKAIAQGKTQIWVRTIDGGFTDSCTVTVLAGLNQPDVTWNQVQDMSLLTEGTKVFIASERIGEDYVLGLYDYDVAKSNIRGAAAKFSDDHHAVTASASYAYTVSIVDGKYVFRNLDGLYLCDYNSKNLSTQETLDNKAKWTVTMDEMFIFKIANLYNTGYEIYNNHNSDMFCCYNAFDKSNMSHLVIYSNNAPAWVEPIRIPELTITVDKDTITDILDFGEVVYDDSWGTEVNPYEAAKTLKFTTKWLTEDIALSMNKGTAFMLYTQSVGKDGGSASIQFSVKQKGTYEDTLYVKTGDIARKIVLTAKTVTQEEAAPQLTLSTTSITLNPNIDNDLTDDAEMTFSVKNLVKPLYIKWEKGEIPDQAGEGTTILAGNEAANIDFGAATNMELNERTDEPILFEATGYTPGTYVSTLCFYTPDAVDKSKNAFEQRVTITIIITKELEPTDLSTPTSTSTLDKFIHNGHLYIRKDNKTYNVIGIER